MMATNNQIQIAAGILSNQPANINFLSPLGFRFTLKRSPTVNFFVTDATIPSFDLGFINQVTPFSNIKRPGDKPEWGSFNLTFKIDENFVNYLEIYNWILGLGFPNNYEQYSKLAQSSPGSGVGITSDGTLTILNSSMAPNMEVQMLDLFPISLSPVDFTTTDTSINYVTATVEFKFTTLIFNKLNGY
jgi:hypothetical protein